jgi:hypothetical protein
MTATAAPPRNGQLPPADPPLVEQSPIHGLGPPDVPPPEDDDEELCQWCGKPLPADSVAIDRTCSAECAHKLAEDEARHGD